MVSYDLTYEFVIRYPKDVGLYEKVTHRYTDIDEVKHKINVLLQSELEIKKIQFEVVEDIL